MFNKKIVIIILSAVLAVTVIGAGIFAVVSSKNNDNGESTTSAPVDSGNVQNSQQTDENNQSSDDTQADSNSQGGDSASTDEVTDLSNLIIGSWKDSTGMSGYCFYENGTVEMTYVNLTIPVLNWPINGTSKGVYTLEGDQLTTTFSIYSASIVNKFTVSVENNTLKMFNQEERETATYQKEASVQNNTVNTDGPDGVDIAGSWSNGDGSFGYKFNSDGTVSITEKGNTYGGVYLLDGDKVTIQYMYGADKVTKRYTYNVSSNNLTLVEGNDMTILVRSGTATQMPSGDDGIYGLWRDGANMSGYEFKDGGVVEVTFVNFTVPVINMPINGTYPGSFSVNGDKLTVSYSIYGKNITDTFTFEVTDNTLKLTGADGNTATYIRQ